MTKPDLKALSDAATQGEWRAYSLDQCVQIYSETYVGETRDDYGDDAALIVALVNAYRSGDLVQRAPEREADGWIVGNGAGDAWRTWHRGWSGWCSDRDMATRYARREDAEAVHAEDEDAWQVIPYRDPTPVVDVEASINAIALSICKADSDCHCTKSCHKPGSMFYNFARAALTAMGNTDGQ